MGRLQGAALLAAVIGIQFTAPQYRLGAWALYDLAIAAMWVLLLIWPTPLNRVSQALIGRVTLVLLVIFGSGGVATLYAANILGLEPVFRDMVRIGSGLALYAGVWFLISFRYTRLEAVANSLVAVSGYYGLMAIVNMGGAQRYQGAFTNPNYFAVAQSVAFVLLVARITDPAVLRRNRAAVRVGTGLLLGIVGFSIILTFSRGAYVAAVLGTAAVLGGRLRRYPRGVLKFGLILSLTSFFIAFSADKIPGFARWGSRLQLSSIMDSGGSGRSEIWLKALWALTDNPLGYGPGGDQIVIGMAGHNIFVETAMQFGVIGLGLIVTFWLLAANDAAHLFRFHKTALELGLAGGIVVVLTSSLTLSMLLFRLFWLVLGVAAAAAKHESVTQHLSQPCVACGDAEVGG